MTVVRFLKNWTWAAHTELTFVMRDFKEGEEVRLTRAQYARAKAAGVIEDGEKNKNRRQRQSAEEAQGDAEGNPAGDGGVDLEGRGGDDVVDEGSSAG